MDQGLTLLIMIMVIMVVFALLTTSARVIRPGEIGFVYRGRKFLRHIGPALVLAPPIIGRVYRIKVESLHAVFESSEPRTEILLDIADPSRVPVTSQNLDSEIKGLTSKAVREALSRRKSASSRQDLETLAEELKLRLDRSLETLGLRVRSIIVGDHSFDYPVSERPSAGIPDWENPSNKSRRS